MKHNIASVGPAGSRHISVSNPGAPVLRIRCSCGWEYTNTDEDALLDEHAAHVTFQTEGV